MTDKQLLLSGKSSAKTTNERLDICGKALRDTVTHGIAKLKANTVRAVIGHITDILPDPDGDFFQPLARDYIQTLVVLLGHPVHVENLAVFDASGWLLCIDFVVARISRLMEDAESSPFGLSLVSRASPAPGTTRQSSGNNLNGRSRNSSQRVGGQLQQNDLTPLMQCLLSLVSTCNAPCLTRRHEITNTVFGILRLRLNFGKLQRVAFATLNCILLKTAGDDPALGRTITTEIIPLLGYWWQPRAIDNDELLFSVRDEMLKTIHGIHLYLDSILQDASSAALLGEVEDLLDSFWAEYSQRSHQSRLRLDDLTFSSLLLPTGHFSTNLFALRPFTQDAERRWAVVEMMSSLESIFQRQACGNSQRPSGESLDMQPRKKQRFVGGSNRLHRKMLSFELAHKMTAFQLIPFFLPHSKPSAEDILAIVDDLMPFISDKQGMLSSWAMIACAR